MMGTERFSGRTIVVSGAASGIGAATAVRAAVDGATVLLLDIDDSRGEDVRATIEEAGGRAAYLHCDVSDEAAWADAVRAAHALGNPVGGLVCNAFTVTRAPADATPLAVWERQLAVNLTGAFLAMRAFLPDLRAVPDASVVLVSSVHALVGLPSHPAYAAAKAGQTGLARQLAVEYGPDIRVNSVLPGPVLTAAWDGIGEEDRAKSAAETVSGRLGQPAEVAAAIAFLLSADASFVTGASLVVDGGWSVFKNSS